MTESSSSRYGRYAEVLAGYRDADRLRAVRSVTGRAGAFVVRDGRRYLNLSSNDYLGYASDAGLHESFYGNGGEPRTLERFGLGATASRLMTGSSEVSDVLEQEIAAAYGSGCEVLLLNSGYHANVGILPTLTTRADLILSDRLNHASIVDGMRLSDAPWHRYRHADLAHLEGLLRKLRAKHEQVFIVTESVFSMDGDVADIAGLVALAHEYNALLYVDEAHAVGVMGPRGLGVSADQGVLDQVDVVVGTFGKALASQGAFAVLRSPLREYLVNTMRPFIFTTGLPPVSVCWSLSMFRRMLMDDTGRQTLAQLGAQFREALVENGVTTCGSSQIVPAICGTNRAAAVAAHALQEAGILALPVRPPTVPDGTARVRFSLTADMTWGDLAPVVPCIAGSIES